MGVMVHEKALKNLPLFAHIKARNLNNLGMMKYVKKPFTWTELIRAKIYALKKIPTRNTKNSLYLHKHINLAFFLKRLILL